MGCFDRSRSRLVRYSYAAPNQSDVNLQKNQESGGVQLLPGHTKLENTVRYLGIEVDDALAISEQTEV